MGYLTAFVGFCCLSTGHVLIESLIRFDHADRSEIWGIVGILGWIATFALSVGVGGKYRLICFSVIKKLSAPIVQVFSLS